MSLSSNRNSFGTSLLLCYPSNAIEHPLCRLERSQAYDDGDLKLQRPHEHLTYHTDREHLHVKEMLKVLECISNHYTKPVCSKKRGNHAYE